MRNYHWGFVLVMAAAASMLSPEILAQDVPRTADRKPDFTGLWAPPPAAPSASSEASEYQGGNAPRRLTRRERGLARIPLAEWGREAFLYYTAADGEYGGETGGASDPRYHDGACGGPRSPADLGDAFQIYQTPQMLMLTAMRNQPWIRKIWIGQEHPEDVTEYVPFWMGHSVGRWEGDTLVVDTVRIKEGTLIDTRQAIPHSGNLRMTERFSFDTNGNLRIDRTFEDPVAFSTPWSDSKNLVRQTDWDEMRFLWEVEENHGVCDPQGGYWREYDPWFENYDELKEEVLPDAERLEQGLPPVPEEFRQQ